MVRRNWKYEFSEFSRIERWWGIPGPCIAALNHLATELMYVSGNNFLFDFRPRQPFDLSSGGLHDPTLFR